MARTGGGLPMVARVGQQHGNNTRGSGGSNSGSNINYAIRRQSTNRARSQARAGRHRSSGGAHLQRVKSQLKALKR
jgi:hypothetical protein